MALNLSTSGQARLKSSGVTDYDNLTAITIACWVKLDSGHDSQTHDVLSKWDYPDDKGWILARSNASNKWFFECAYDDSSNTDFVTPTSATAATDVWVHLVATWTPTYRALYVDGVVPSGASDSTSRTTISDTATTVGLYLGGQNNSTANTFEGDLYQACIWLNYALSADEVAALAAGMSPLQFGPSGPNGLMLPLDTEDPPDIEDWGPLRLASAKQGTTFSTTLENPPVAPLLRLPQSFFEEAAAPSGISPVGIPSTSSVGSPSIGGEVRPNGIASTSAVGAPTLGGAVAPDGIPSTSSVGTPSFSGEINPAGIASSSSVGSPTVAADGISPVGIPSTSSVGSPSTGGEVRPTGIASTSSVGAPTLGGAVAPDGIPSTSSVGTPSFSGEVTPAGIASTSSVGSPVVSAPDTILPVGIASTSTVGSPTVQGDSFWDELLGDPAAAAPGTAREWAHQMRFVLGIAASQRIVVTEDPPVLVP